MSFDHTTTVELFAGAQQQAIGLARIDHVPPVLDAQTIMRLAAKALIRELSDAQKSTDRESLVNLSIKYGILCPHTAFIGVEKRLNTNSESNANMELREVPIMIHTSAQGFRHLSSSIFYQTNQVISTMRGINIDQILARAQNLSALTERADCLSIDSACFYKTASRRSTVSSSVGSIMQPVVGFVSSLFTKKKTQNHETPIDSASTVHRKRSSTDQSSYNLSSTNSQITEIAWPTDEQKLVDRLIELQQYDGLWMLTADDVKQLTGKSLTAFSSSAIENIEKDRRELIITTAIVIVVLETRCSSMKTLWQALSNKANKRLKELLGGDEAKFEQLMKDIRDQYQ
jgi:hypothetical protein